MPRGLPDSFLLTGALRLGRYLKGRDPWDDRGRRRPTAYYWEIVDVKLYRSVLRKELRSHHGMVGRYMHKVGNRVAQRARLQVGVDTGKLRASIKFSHIRSRGEAAVKVGGYTDYALMHHQGTRPHIITPNRPGGQLVFVKGSRVIRTPIVRHPGTKPNRYLTDQIRPPIVRKILR